MKYGAILFELILIWGDIMKLHYRNYHFEKGIEKVKTKFLITLSAAGLLIGSSGIALAAIGGASAAAMTPHDYSPNGCGGNQIVNVTYKLYNDTDSGFYGNWANDSLSRSLKVFSEGNGTYCATVNDTGSFVTTGPNSPQNGVPLAAGIEGVINGGYVTNDFSATLSSNPAYKTHGNLGTFDSNLDHPSFLSYFNNPGSINWTQPVWGWTYHTAKNGDWTNASSGNSGDIYGS